MDVKFLVVLVTYVGLVGFDATLTPIHVHDVGARGILKDAGKRLHHTLMTRSIDVMLVN